MGPPKPDMENESYGPHERNVMDMWLIRPEIGCHFADGEAWIGKSGR